MPEPNRSQRSKENIATFTALIRSTLAETRQRQHAAADRWTGWVASALTETDVKLRSMTRDLQDIEVRETHRVHEHAATAIIRARKPLD